MSTVIESLKVRNFEGYKDEEFPFFAGLNLVVGRNSTGKAQSWTPSALLFSVTPQTLTRSFSSLNF